MKLFNKYKNKNFMYLTNYINSCISNEELALTPEELEYQLLGTSQNTFEEFIHAVLNQSVFPNHNAGLLYKDDQNKLQPIREVPIPVRASIAEKAWLYYVLQTSNSDLFLNSELKQKLLDALLKDISFKDYPLQQHYIDIREFSTESCLDITPQFITQSNSIGSSLLPIKVNPLKFTLTKLYIPIKLNIHHNLIYFASHAIQLVPNAPLK